MYNLEMPVPIPGTNIAIKIDSINTMELNDNLCMDGYFVPYGIDHTEIIPEKSINIKADDIPKGTITIDKDVEIKGNKISTAPSKMHLEDGDIIILTIDPEIYDNAWYKCMLETWEKAFPNHKVVMILKGTEISLIHDDSSKEHNASW